MAYSWTETAPGIWRRELGGLEKTYRFMSQIFKHTGHEHWGLYAICTVDFSANQHDIATTLRHAWQALRIEFPGLAVTVDGYKAEYRIATKESLAIWTEQTFVVDPDKQADEIIADYPLNALPQLYYLPAKSEVLLLTSHWRVDAIGCCLLLDRLLALASEQTESRVPAAADSDRTHLPSPPMEDAAGAPLTPTAEINAMTQEVTTRFAQKARSSIGIPYAGNTTTPPGQPAYESAVFTSESTAALVEACRDRKISVSAAVYAALGAAIFRMRGAGNDAAEDYSTIMAVNMRPHLQPPYDTPQHACQAYVSSITPTVRRAENFTTNTEDLTRYFRTWHTSDYNKSLREIYRRASQGLINTGSRPPAGGPPPHGITLSSLGVIDNFFSRRVGEGKCCVRSFRFGVCMMTRQMLLYVWTFGGQLQLSVDYNSAYYSSETPKELLKCVKEVLEAELAVTLTLTTAEM
ncbi:hypothetical protein B0H66DRAFT_528922 [Apodospora peruviana]|uniref:Phthiocerol/phthiodiolone dimycocerosyl transferase C-terminal domain-containing protein n=1 Tax=Apodospora peruviana TaxID=516989 RepID=A0AAE0IGT6_9PEZI|nr:hypothetical protein B0H66DRAFT_528922 [Apodospora peruviana]